jgi:lipopolysaccharide export LptBFGC system permease protein LptF
MIIHRYLVRRVLIALALLTIGIYVPVLLISLFNHLPSAAIFSDLVWPATGGIAPLLLYISLPAMVGAAITWTYSQLWTEGTLATLYNAGLSATRVRLPALVVAVGATAVGYALSCAIAPIGAKYLQDVLHVVKREPRPSLLEPNRLYVLSDGRREIRFGERIDKTQIGDLYFREIAEDGEERNFFARVAAFEIRNRESWIILHDGVVETRKRGAQPDVAAFNHIARPSGLGGPDLPVRDWVGYFEFGPIEFLRAFPEAQQSPADAKRWAIEAVKRLGVPSLSISHALLGLALLMLVRAEYRRTRGVAELCCGIVFAVHLLIVGATEQAIFYGEAFAWAIGVMIVAELVGAAALFWYAISRNDRRPVRAQTARSIGSFER